MKWENCDINVVEPINEIVTRLRPLELFFDDALVNKIVGYTKLYSHREKAGVSFEITNEKNCFCLSMLRLRGCLSFQTIKRFGRKLPILLCKEGLIRCLVIHSSVFLINKTNETNSRGSFAWLMSQIGFLSSISTGRTNPSYDSMLRNSELMAPGNELTTSQFKRNTKSGSLLQRYMAM